MSIQASGEKKKQIGKVDLFGHETEPALEDNQFRLATEEAVLNKSIAIADTGLSLEKQNIQAMNLDILQVFLYIQYYHLDEKN